MKNASTIQIGSRKVGPQHPPFLIAEVAQSHDGSLGQAHAFIDAVATTGVDAIKFQTHIAEAESTPSEPFRVKFSRQDTTRYEYWKRMEFTAEQWAGLAQHAREKGLIFLSSPFSIQAVELLDRLDMPAWKIGSGEVTNLPMIEQICKKSGPILISTGLSDIHELDSTLAVIQEAGKEFAIFQCTSEYPSPPEKAGLNLLSTFAERWRCPVGFSDHSGKIYAGLAAITSGAHLLEVHVALNKQMFGPDVSSSLSVDDLRTLAEGTREIHQILSHPVDKNAAFHSPNVQTMRSIFGRSIYAQQDLPAGCKLELQHLAFKKPGTGLPARDYKSLLGKTLRRQVRANELILKEDLD